jgi:uncharacterized protein (DUF885 family)
MHTVNRFIFLSVLIYTTLVGCQSVDVENTSVTDLEADKFTQLANKIVAYRNSIDPYQHTSGVDGYYLPNLSAQFLQQNDKQNQQFLVELEQIDVSVLDEQNQINHAIIYSQVKNTVDEYYFNAHYMPLTSEFGFHSALTFMISRSSFDSQEDFKLYLKRLAAVPRYFEQNIYWMRQGIKSGLTQPQPVLTGYEDSIKAFIVEQVEESDFYRPFKTKPEYLSESEFLTLTHNAKEIIEQKVIPSYLAYLTFFESEYVPNARKEIGISSTPNGEAFYQNRVRYFTTTNMTAQQVHQLGVAEVARIRAEMEQVIAKTGFKGSFSEFVAFLRSDPQFYAKSSLELLKEASYIAKKADAQLPKFFKVLPRTPYGVAPVPSSIAPKYTTGRYVGPNKDTSPGYYWVNTYGLDKRPLYVLEALTLHEAVPGHHLQISLNKELEDVPDYRRNHYISAFGEGWGLYSEYLGKEMGFYQDAYSDFGRLTYEMWRAARLVVDTGMHMFGWSRQQTMDFMQQNSALSLHNIKTETDRYISWPGQALSYKVGELTIKRLREKTENALGQNFDIREFHFQVLKNGSLPLSLLERQIDEYIQREQVSVTQQ